MDLSWMESAGQLEGVPNFAEMCSVLFGNLVKIRI